MTFISHTLVTTVGAQVLHLEGWNLILAYLFGVLIDFDHLLKFPLCFKKKRANLGNVLLVLLLGVSSIKFKPKFILKKEHYHWRTSLQEPVALLYVVPLSIFINSSVPVIFFLGHLALDYLSNYPKFPFYPFSNFCTRGLFTSVNDKIKELIIIAVVLCILIILMRR